VRVSDAARGVLLDLYSRALTGHGRPLTEGIEAAALAEGLLVTARRTPGRSTVVVSPAGRMELVDLALTVAAGHACEEVSA
jgi:hypothetical protein